MTLLHLKLIALITMIIDHTGYMIFTDDIRFRLIGRISFPIYAFFITEGVKYTSNINNYLKRLLGLAIFCQIGFHLSNMFNTYETATFHGTNILFTLFLGASGIHIYNTLKEKNYKHFLLTIPLIMATIFKTDYGFWGVILIYMFYFIGTNPIWGILWVIMKSNIIIYLMLIPINTLEGTSFVEMIGSMTTVLSTILDVSFFTIIPFFLIDYYIKNPKQSNLTSTQKNISKNLFYIAYPLHFLALGIIRYLYN